MASKLRQLRDRDRAVDRYASQEKVLPGVMPFGIYQGGKVSALPTDYLENMLKADRLPQVTYDAIVDVLVQRTLKSAKNYAAPKKPRNRKPRFRKLKNKEQKDESSATA